MIEMFNDVPVRKSGIIYNSTFEQIKKLYEMNPEQAGELAIAAIELTLTGQFSSDDVIIELMLEPAKIVGAGDRIKYEQKVENSRQKKINEQKLDQIAALMQQGFKQREVAQKLGLTQQTVSYRWGVIKAQYPELLQTEDSDLPNLYQKTNNESVLPNVYQNTNENAVLPNTYQNTDATKKQNSVQTGTKKNVCKNSVADEVNGDKPWRF